MDRFLKISKKWLPILLYVVIGFLYWRSLKPETREVTGSLTMAALIFWEFWGKKNKRYQYTCIIKKKILTPKSFYGDWTYKSTIRLYNRIVLPFIPQLGMSLSESYTLPKPKREYEPESWRFNSGAINNIHWDNGEIGDSEPGKFWCEVAPDDVTEDCDLTALRMKILDCLLEGWKPEDSNSEEIIREQISLLLKERSCFIDKNEKDKKWDPDRIERERARVERESYILKTYSGIKIDLQKPQSA